MWIPWNTMKTFLQNNVFNIDQKTLEYNFLEATAEEFLGNGLFKIKYIVSSKFIKMIFSNKINV